jgi:putative endonuclease
MPVKLSSLHIPEKPPGMLDQYSWIYMMCSSSRRALYTGVTGDLNQRVFQHKNGLVEGFTKKYKCHRLVYYESFSYIGEAIAREKEIKGWRREKKNALVETMNPQWRDLSAGWYKELKVPPQPPPGAGSVSG